jgi:hypothetical protein
MPVAGSERNPAAGVSLIRQKMPKQRKLKGWFAYFKQT